MATRSRIGILKDGEIISAYCHWDGYAEHNGQALLDHFFEKRQVEMLLEDGYISSIDLKTGEIERANSVVLATDATLRNFLERAEQCWAEYAYIFSDNEWLGWQLKENKWYELLEVTKSLPR